MLAAFFVFFFLRESLDEIIRYKILAPLRGAVQRTVHNVACFVMDKPVRSAWFYAIGEWSVIMFLRSPALVLMYSATNDSLVMPSYPLEPTSAVVFKFLQVLLAILILTQTMLPLCGAMIIGTWLYLFRWGPFVAIDAIPVVTAGILYIMSPWQSHKLAITRINAQQTRWIRIVFGARLRHPRLGEDLQPRPDHRRGRQLPVDHERPDGRVLHDGHRPLGCEREAWVVSFALAEVMSGFMVMMGVFTRVWATIMIVMFTKLTLVDFGWDEIPHIYPIGAALAVVTSNHLKLRVRHRRATRAGPAGRCAGSARSTLVAVSATVIAFLAVMPMLYFLTFTDRSLLR